MDLSTYEELTGITVPTNQQPSVEAQIRRTQRILESLLGFTLDSNLVDKNFYIEQGKSPIECPCPNVDPENLNPADAVVNAYRLYDYNYKDKYFHVDPFTGLHSVKLVKDGVTYKTFEPSEYRAQYVADWAKFIENCESPCACIRKCKCTQLAVDADWLFTCNDSSVDSSVGGCIAEDLLYVWADMIKYYVDCKKDVKQESIGSHSYTKFDREAPEHESANLSVLKKYAGPKGSLTKVFTT